MRKFIFIFFLVTGLSALAARDSGLPSSPCAKKAVESADVVLKRWGLPPRQGTGFIVDISDSTDLIGPAENRERATYGHPLLRNAVLAYLPVKEFNDGTLDFFLSLDVGDPDPELDLGKVYWAVSSFGAQGRAVRGMKRNPEAKRNIRLMVLGHSDQIGKEIPANMVNFARELHEEFGVPVAINRRFGYMSEEGEMRVGGPDPWSAF